MGVSLSIRMYLIDVDVQNSSLYLIFFSSSWSFLSQLKCPCHVSLFSQYVLPFEADWSERESLLSTPTLFGFSSRFPAFTPTEGMPYYGEEKKHLQIPTLTYGDIHSLLYVCASLACVW